MVVFLALIMASMAVFCKEYYKINNATSGLVLTDAAFITDLSGESVRQKGRGFSGYPRIHAALGVESLAAGMPDIPGRGMCNLTLLNGGDDVDINYDIWQFPLPWLAALADVTAGDLQYVQTEPIVELFNRHKLNMPYPEGSTLCDGTTSKLFGSVANSYSAFVLYMLAGKACPASKGGPIHIVTYDKGGDATTVIWNIFENAKQTAAGELKANHKYRLLWAAMDAQAEADKEANLGRVTVPEYPPLTFPAGGSLFNAYGIRRVYFMDDSIMMDGDAVHKVEGHIGAACQPLIHLGWEDMGKGRV